MPYASVILPRCAPIVFALASITALSDLVRADETGNLAKAAQNPVADLISLPFQNNTSLNVGPLEGVVDVLNIQPVIPVRLNEDWNLITADWDVRSSDRWTVPVGGGLGRVFNLGSQPINTSVQGYYNIEAPTFGADWTLRLQLQLLFPK